MHASNGHKEIVETLIQFGANTETKDNRGRTPLIYAILNDNKEIAKTLIQAGANTEAKSDYGLTPLMYASLSGRKEIVEILQTFDSSAKK